MRTVDDWHELLFIVGKRLQAEQSRTKILLFDTLDGDLSFNDAVTVPSALKG